MRCMLYIIVTTMEVNIIVVLICTTLTMALTPHQPIIRQLSENTYKYYVIKQHNVTWSRAEKVCRAALPGGHLARLNDDVTMKYIRHQLPVSEARMWIAGHQLAENDWTWVSGQQGQVFRGVPEPDEQCGTLSVTGVYKAKKCTYTTPWFICYLPTEACSGQINSSCSTIFANSKTCIAVCQSDNPVTWFQARNNCLRRSGDLVSLDDESLASKVIGKIEYRLGHTQHIMWLGLRRNPWIWSARDQPQETTYTYWAPDEPRVAAVTNKCMAVEAMGEDTTWIALDCHRSIQAMICQAPLNCEEVEITTNTSTHAIAEPSWLDNKISIVVLSVSGGMIVVLLLVIASLVVCLRNAKRLNVMLGSGPKTYFDYFDFGFRRLMPSNQQSGQDTRTVVLTDDMLKSPGASTNNDTKRTSKCDPGVDKWRNQGVVHVGKGRGSSSS